MTSSTQTIQQHIFRRYQRNLARTLRDVYDLDASFIDPQDWDVDFAFSNRETLLEILQNPRRAAEIVDLFIRQTEYFTFSKNQFFPYPAEQRIELEERYRSYIGEIVRMLQDNPAMEDLRKAYRTLLRGHFFQIRTILQKCINQVPQVPFLDREVICAEYSPELQCHCLRIDINQLKEPVLDLGCGRHASLVRYLRSRGIQACGLDREAPETDNTLRVDWLNYPLKPAQWGSILSHMAFSNHFHFLHHSGSAAAEQYAALYRTLLDSLLPGGSLYYTPGLPFIENLLPANRYAVQISSIPLTSDQSQAHFYAAKVLKLS